LNNFIHQKAQLGSNVRVEHFSAVYEDVIIGDNTWIGPNVTIFPGTRIGSIIAEFFQVLYLELFHRI
jgi:UDP-3-O-[3-hydroxymyristoyl] glucosamine N-acyltransferase